MNCFDARDFLTSEDNFDLLGRGSYASVRRCHHQNLGTVVVKYFELVGSKVAIEEQYESIKNEANVLCRLNHENIIKMFGVTKWSKYYGVVMEEASGHNLEDLVIHANDKPISWPLRLQFCVEIAEGLNYLHYHDPKRSYIHGDLKLQNILLSHDLVVKIADFGAVSLLQATGCSVGSLDIVPSKQHTWLYSAPEFLNNPEMQRTRAMDVYSYAMICYEIITRNRAFARSGNSVPMWIGELIKDGRQKPNIKLINQVKQSLSDKSDREICSQLENTVVQCWQTNPEDRPTIKEVKDKLKTIVSITKLRQHDATHLIKKATSSTTSLRNVTLNRFDPSFEKTFNSSQNSTLLSSNTSLLQPSVKLDLDPSKVFKREEILQVKYTVSAKNLET